MLAILVARAAKRRHFRLGLKGAHAEDGSSGAGRFSPSEPPPYEGRIAISAATELSRKAGREIGDAQFRKAIQKAPEFLLGRG